VRPWQMSAVMTELGMRRTIDRQIGRLRALQVFASKLEQVQPFHLSILLANLTGLTCTLLYWTYCKKRKTRNLAI
jgi:hypothetical protein